MATYKSIAYGNTGVLANASGEVLLSSVTASSSATVDFTSSIDSTYKEYVFRFDNVHPASNAQLTVNFRDGGSDFDASKQSTAFNPYHQESGGSYDVIYRAAWDLANSTSDQIIAQELSNEADASASGYLHLFDPSNTSHIKHFIGVTTYSQYIGSDASSFQVYYQGYCNTTTAIDGVRFKMSSGNIDAGTIKMYGII